MPVGEAFEKATYAGEFVGQMQTFGGLGRGHGRQGFRQVAAAQDGAGTGTQFAHPELLGMVVAQVEILVDTPAASGVTEQRPAACLPGGTGRQAL